MKTSLVESASPAVKRAIDAGVAMLGTHMKRGKAMKLVALTENPETIGVLHDFIAGEDTFIQLLIRPGEAVSLAVMIDHEHPDVLLLEGQGARESELDALAGTIARNPELAVILVCQQRSPEFLLRALRIGVREVMQAPVTCDALQQAIDHIRERQNSREAGEEPGKVLALLPCKGGAGATFLATNLARCLAAEGKRVCLIDLNLQFGEASLYVSEARPPSNVADVLQQIQRLDGPLLESSMLQVAPNFWLLAAPESPEAVADIQPESIERLLDVARHSHDFVLLDLSRAMDLNTIRALDNTDEIYLVLQMTLPFLRDAARMLRLFRSLAYPDARIHLLVNRVESGGDISLKEVERGLGFPVSRTIPNSFRAVSIAINQGCPIIEKAPQDPVTRALREMARHLARTPVQRESWLHRLLRRKSWKPHFPFVKSGEPQ